MTPESDPPKPNADQDLWSRVDDYLVDRLVQPDEALVAALADSAAAGLPPDGSIGAWRRKATHWTWKKVHYRLVTAAQEYRARRRARLAAPT